MIGFKVDPRSICVFFLDWKFMKRMLFESSLVDMTRRPRVEKCQESECRFFHLVKRWAAFIRCFLQSPKPRQSLTAPISGPSIKLSYLAVLIASSISSSGVKGFLSVRRSCKILSRSLSQAISASTSVRPM